MRMTAQQLLLKCRAIAVVECPSFVRVKNMRNTRTNQLEIRATAGADGKHPVALLRTTRDNQECSVYKVS